MVKESEYCSKVAEKEFNKPLVIAEIDHEDFTNSSECWICKKAFEEGEVKLKDHNHITRNYRGFAHKECNLNLNLTKKKPCCFS